MDMLEGASVLFFGVSLWVVTLGIRRVVEVAWAGAKENRIWRDAVLPLLPSLLGGASAGLLASMPIPSVLSADASQPMPVIARVMYGIVVGHFASYFYRAAKTRVSSSTSPAAATSHPASFFAKPPSNDAEPSSSGDPPAVG